jgi:hypothetical protein
LASPIQESVWPIQELVRPIENRRLASWTAFFMLPRGVRVIGGRQSPRTGSSRVHRAPCAA